MIGLLTFFFCVAITTGQNQGFSGRIVDSRASSPKAAATPEPSDDLCLTPSCIHSAARILRAMNSRAEPCDDFYEFACGNFEKSAIIPRDYVAVSSSDHAHIQVLNRLRKIIEAIDQSDAPKHFRLVKTFYNNCMKDSWTSGESHFVSALKYLNDANGWPLRSKGYWNEAAFDYVFTTSSLFSSRFAPDVTNSTVWIAQLEEQEPPLNRNYLRQGFSSRVVRAYYQYMVDIAVAMGIDKSEAKLWMRETLFFEMELYELVFVENKNRNWNSRWSKETLKRLNEKYRTLQFPEEYTNYDGGELQLSVDLETLKRADDWVAGKSKKALANWEAWRFISAQVPDFGGYFAHRTKLFNRILDGNREESTKWTQCVRKTANSLGFALGALYQRKYVSHSSLKDLIMILDNVKQQFSEFIQKANWLSAMTKSFALEKVANLESNLVTCHDFIRDDELEIFYRELELSDSSFGDTLRNESEFHALNNPYTTTLNETGRTKCGNVLIESQYSGQLNFIQFAAELYTEFFHDIDRPKYLNYGAAGTFIGHEIGHSLDDENRHFDKNGNLLPWWDSESNGKYINRTQCLINQYGNYTVEEFNILDETFTNEKIDAPGNASIDDKYWAYTFEVSNIHVNGFSTLNENIADNVGLKAAYYAYVKGLNASEPEKRLPGLDFSPKQMFWISMANSLCGKYRGEYLKGSVYEERTSPYKYRVNGPASNLPEFASDFQCNREAKMNPAKKCDLWPGFSEPIAKANKRRDYYPSIFLKVQFKSL